MTFNPFLLASAILNVFVSIWYFKEHGPALGLVYAGYALAGFALLWVKVQ